MSKLNCNVVRDILPLYADEVVCQDTKVLVEEHLEECIYCRKELRTMQEQMVLPVQPDSAQNLKKVKKKWGRKQLWKGAGIMLVLAVIFFGSFVYCYNCGFLANSKDVNLITGLECANFTTDVTQIGTDVFYQSVIKQQQWNIRIEAKEGVQLIVDSEVVWEENENGEHVKVQETYYVKTFPFAISFDRSACGNVCPFNTTACASWYEIPQSGDCIIKIVFADKELTYSMLEEGVWDLSTEHDSDFCYECGKNQ